MATGRGRARGHARAKCAKCGKALNRAFSFCPYCGNPLEATAARALPRRSGPKGPPVAAGPSLQVKTERSDALEEQRKVITVMFIDLAGSTATAEGLDPEEWRRILQRYFAVLSKQIERFGGTIDKYIGDAVMAVFGAPIAREDDPHRAISAALAIKSEMARENEELQRRFGLRLNLRTGINSGEVVAGLLSGGAEGAYTVTGDTVNTAQRLESAAPPNEVLVGEATYQLTRRAFVFEALAPLTLKGKKEPVPTYRVIMRERRAVPRETLQPFVGRASELGVLRRLFEEASAGRGRLVHLHGDAGVGKSRLIIEFFASLPPEATRLRPRCTSYETATPYALVADLVRRVFRVQPTDDEPAARARFVSGLAASGMPAEGGSIALLLELLGYGGRSELDPETKRRVLVSTLRLLLSRLSASSPLVVVAEDVHWIDSASTGLLRDVLVDVPTLRCLFITTSRQEAAPWPGMPLALEPLDESSAAEMLDRVAGAPLDPSLRATVIARTGGNPFFMEEVVRSLGARATATVPATVQEVLQARLDALDPDAKRVAQRAAVIGRSFSAPLLAHFSRDLSLEAPLGTLEAQGFIVRRAAGPEPTYTFRHALMQEAAYQILLIAQRRKLHEAVGGAIEALYAGRLEEFVDALAFHYGRGDNDDKAADWQVRAGDRAKRLFANEEALALYTAALGRARDTGPVPAAEIEERVGDVQTVVGRYDEAIARFRAVRERLASPSLATLARLERKRGIALRVKGEYPSAFGAFEEGLNELGTTDDLEAARIKLEIGQLHWRSGNFPAARQPLADAIAIGERLGLDDVVALALRLRGNVSLFGEGDLNSAEAFYRRSRAIYERLDDRVGIAAVRNNLGIVYRRMGRWDEALAEYQASLALREQMGDPWDIGISHNNIGEFHRLRGELVQAIPAFERSFALFERIHAAVEAVGALMNLGAARVESGDVERGRAELLEAERRHAALGTSQYQPVLYRYLASAELAVGDLAAAQRAAERSLELARVAGRPHHEAMARRVLGEIALAHGDERTARELLEASRRALADLGEKDELARTEVVLRRLELQATSIARGSAGLNS